MSSTLNPLAKINPLAAPSQSGMPDYSPEGYVDVDFSYVYDVVLTANQVLTDQAVSTMNDADFAIRAVFIGFSTGAFNVRFSDSQGYYLSNGLIASGNLLGDASSPMPVWPEILIPAGGKIGIDITDTSGAGNTIEIVFRGVKRYQIV